MPDIFDLIWEKCSDGVPVVRVDELCYIQAGGDVPDDMVAVADDIHKIPVVGNGTAENAICGYTGTMATVIKPAVTVAARGSIGYAAFRDYPYTPVIRLLNAIPRDEGQLDAKFLYYTLADRQYNVMPGGIPQFTVRELARVKIPLPPLQIQREIVAILDKFDMYCNDMTAGLVGELEMRRKQYLYLAETLLTFGDDVPVVSMNEVFDICPGHNPVKSKVELWDGDVNYFTIDDIRKSGHILIDSKQHVSELAVRDKPIPADTLVVSVVATIGVCALIKTPFLTNSQLWALVPKGMYTDAFMPEYLVHYGMMIGAMAKRCVNDGGIPFVNGTQFGKMFIPVPNMVQQREIVDILDKLCELERELELRRKQYGYYRDMLLAFPEKKGA